MLATIASPGASCHALVREFEFEGRMPTLFFHRQIALLTESRSSGLRVAAVILIAFLSGLPSVAMEGAPAPEVARFSEGEEAIPEAWEPMTFPKVKQHTRYRPIQEKEGDPWVIEATSDAGASGLIHRTSIDIGERPILRWRWKVEDVLQKGDVRTKEGDDYAARIYLIFDPDLSDLTFFQRTALRIARGLYGDVPGRAISYLWASKLEQGKVAESPYAGGFAKLVAVKSGAGEAGAWHLETRDVAEDYRALFGTEPAPLVGVAIMTDSDDTQESVRAWYGDIEFLSRDAAK